MEAGRRGAGGVDRDSRQTCASHQRGQSVVLSRSSSPSLARSLTGTFLSHSFLPNILVYLASILSHLHSFLPNILASLLHHLSTFLPPLSFLLHFDSFPLPHYCCLCLICFHSSCLTVFHTHCLILLHLTSFTP